MKAKARTVARFSPSTGSAKARALVLSLLACALALGFGASQAIAASPTLAIDPSPSATYTTAHVSGAVDPEGGSVPPSSIPYYFEYSKDPGTEGWPEYIYAGAITEAEAEGTSPIPVAGELTGLQPGTEYHVRLTIIFEGAEIHSPEPNATFSTEGVAAPAVSTEAVTAVTGGSAHFSGSVNPQAPSGNPEVFDVQWHFHCIPACLSVEAVHPIPADAADHDVEADATGLEPNTEYKVTLIAANAGAQAASDPAETFTTDPIAPEVAPGTTTAGEETAQLHARLNPHNSPTTFHFEWGSTAAYGSQTPEAPGGSGATVTVVGRQISGLEPESTYHYRVVADNGTGGPVTGPDRTFTTRPGYLEDRAYEMVSPTQKLGNDITIDGTRTIAAVGGDAIDFYSLGAFGDAKGTGIAIEYIATRGADGWKTHSITPAFESVPVNFVIGVPDPVYRLLSEDLSRGVYMTFSALTDAPNVVGAQNVYLAQNLLDPMPHSYHLLSDDEDPVEPGFGTGAVPFAASSDLSHVIFYSNTGLTPDALAQPYPEYCVSNAFCENVLYEYTAGAVRLVGEIPVAPATSCSGAACVVAPRSHPGNSANLTGYVGDTISEDGRRIFFTVADEPFGQAGPLYLREDGSTTIQINVSEKASPDPPQSAAFRGASADGSKVFFSTPEQLLDADQNNGADLYRWDRDAPVGSRLTFVSVDSEPADGTSGGLDAVYGVSDDGSYVYFTGSGQMVAGGPFVPASDFPVFVWHAGQLTYIGLSTTQDSFKNTPPGFGLNLKDSRVTPDGKRLLFVSTSPNLATGDSSQTCNGDRCRRLYVYSAEANGGEGELACASCRPDGAPSSSHVEVVSINATAPSGPHLNHAILDDGLAFFSTADRLVPEDVNGRYDAYSYDAVAGQVRLISTGRCDCDSYFMDATPDGSNVFFSTREQLVGWDTDNLTDVYDARRGGGLPEPSQPPPGCVGDACQPPATTLNDPTPGSSSFSGAGNTNERKSKVRCGKGRRMAKRHCISKKGGQKRKNRANTERRAGR